MPNSLKRLPRTSLLSVTSTQMPLMLARGVSIKVEKRCPHVLRLIESKESISNRRIGLHVFEFDDGLVALGLNELHTRHHRLAAIEVQDDLAEHLSHVLTLGLQSGYPFRRRSGDGGLEVLFVAQTIPYYTAHHHTGNLTEDLVLIGIDDIALTCVLEQYFIAVEDEGIGFILKSAPAG